MKGKDWREGGRGKESRLVIGRLGSGEAPLSSQPPAPCLSGPPASSRLPTPQPRMRSLPPPRVRYGEAGEQQKSAMEKSTMPPENVKHRLTV